MRATIPCHLASVIFREYEKDGKPRVYRELWVLTAPDQAPDKIRIPLEPAAIDAFEELRAMEWLSEVELVVSIETFGPNDTQSLNLIGIPA